MIGDYVRAGLAWGVFTLLDSILQEVGGAFLAVANCTSGETIPASVTTNYCTYGQQAITWWYEAAILGVILWLIFRGWKESQADASRG